MGQAGSEQQSTQQTLLLTWVRAGQQGKSRGGGGDQEEIIN